ncbi:MAG: iron-sulfur cluster-binding domain-containing protein [Saccharospirillaceae bacterium]|nr:iron-sulfur cluster-binding domain-containing protein [Saccharospirillaceae bacterium]
MSISDVAIKGRSSLRQSFAWRWLADSLTQQQQFSDYAEPLMQMITPNWSSVYSRARILMVRPESDDVFSLIIRPQKNWARHTFTGGQHLELITERDGARHHRTFSISSSPDYFRKTGLIELTIRVQPEGKITPWLRTHFADGGLANISAAKGDFRLAASDDNKPLLMIAGGSGITPFRSMLQQLRDRQSDRAVHLLYYARNKEQFLFPQEFLRLQNELADFRVSLMDSSQLGTITDSHLSRCDFDLSDDDTRVMICGPTPMIQAAKEVVAGLGASEDRVMFEYFGAAPIDQIQGVEGRQYISCQSSSTQFISDSEKPQTLLDLAEQAGLKPVSGCRIGVCHQCICKKQSGVVYNTKTGQTSDTGPGEIQLCVSVAVSDVALDL